MYFAGKLVYLIVLPSNQLAIIQNVIQQISRGQVHKVTHYYAK